MTNPSRFELPEDRLASTDEKGGRVFIHPAFVKGPLRTLRTWVYMGFILFFLVLPWLTVDGRPWLRLDIINRHFYIAGHLFLGSDAPYLFFIFFGGVMTIAIFTALFGRLWCGWACPQTVFIDMFFRRIERLIEGDSRARHALDAAPLSAQKITKRLLKWGLFILCGMLISHSVLALILGPEAVIQLMQSSPFLHPGQALFALVLTGIIVFDFGWFREQFCIIACPYGRFQSLLVDDHSVTVTYDAGRGEPRKKSPKDTQASGDCINCYRCVQVCPTGIDIRRGIQMECIMCTACIDACNMVMTKLGKPKGLIRYTSLAATLGQHTRWFRPRTVLYLSLLAGLAALFAVALASRSPVRATVMRGGIPYIAAENGVIVNPLKVHLYNQSPQPQRLTLSLSSDRGAISAWSPQLPMTLRPGESSVVNVVVRFQKSWLIHGKKSATLTLHTDPHLRGIRPVSVVLVGPDS